jgi:hypothetical protein
MQKFFVGMDNVGKAWRLDRAFVSANRLWDHVGGVHAEEWVMDSGAFTEISTHGRYRNGVEAYAEVIRRFSREDGLLAAVAQDFMCEPFILTKTGMTVADHQRLTIERYDALLARDTGGVYIMPVLQGFDPEDYVRHVEAYGDRLKHGAWVGVGSVCKRQGSPKAIIAVLSAILRVRPDLRLHGFGVKLTSLKDPAIAAMLYSADSMAWSFAARKRNGDQHSLSVAREFEREVLDAAGLPYGDNLSAQIPHLRTMAAEDNAKATERRARQQEWNAVWRRIQDEDRKRTASRDRSSDANEPLVA